MTFTDYWLDEHLVRYLSSQSDSSRQWALVNINNVYKNTFKEDLLATIISENKGYELDILWRSTRYIWSRGLIKKDIIVKEYQNFFVVS